MINTKKAIYKKIKNDYSANDIEETATTLRKLFTIKDE